MRRTWMTALLLLCAVPIAACSGRDRSAPAELVVSAAASLTDALQEVQPLFESEHAGVKLRFNFGSSGALQQQIEQGAPADLFISAAATPMEALVSRQIVDTAAVKTLASNKVVLVRSKAGDAKVQGWSDLAQASRIAVGNPQHVPAGQYGKAVLENLGLWSAAEPKLVLGEDVRQVLHFVESGDVAAGIVYATDAALSQKVLVVAEAPAGSHPPITYPLAVLRESKHKREAEALAEFLLSETGRRVLTKYGFTVRQ